MRPRTHTQQTLPYPPSSATVSFYIESEERGESASFLAEDAEACLQSGVFMLRKKREGDEIDVTKLSPEARELFTGKGGSREKELAAIQAPGAIRIHRGAEARRLRQRYAHRILPSRFLEKWKDMGDSYDNCLTDPSIQS